MASHHTFLIGLIPNSCVGRKDDNGVTGDLNVHTSYLSIITFVKPRFIFNRCLLNLIYTKAGPTRSQLFPFRKSCHAFCCEQNICTAWRVCGSCKTAFFQRYKAFGKVFGFYFSVFLMSLFYCIIVCLAE